MVLTTGRAKGRMIEVCMPLGQTGWMFLENEHGTTVLLPDFGEGGKHGDHLDNANGSELFLVGERHWLGGLRGARNPGLLKVGLAPLDSVQPGTNSRHLHRPFEDSTGLLPSGEDGVTKETRLSTGDVTVGGKRMIVLEGQGQMAYLRAPELPRHLPLPLLVVLHGGSKNRGWNFIDLVQAFGENQDLEEALVLIPEARDYTWDFITTGQRDDVDFIQSAMNDVRRMFVVDDGRIGIIGMSDE